MCAPFRVLRRSGRVSGRRGVITYTAKEPLFVRLSGRVSGSFLYRHIWSRTLAFPINFMSGSTLTFPNISAPFSALILEVPSRFNPGFLGLQCAFFSLVPLCLNGYFLSVRSLFVEVFDSEFIAGMLRNAPVPRERG